ncbi:MAG: hypothetical protein ABWK01_08315 [Infirmifilum sp.]
MPVRLIRLKRLIDLIHVLNVSQLPLIHHYTLDSTHLYFVPVTLGGEPSVIYYYESAQPLQGVYVLFNNFTGEIIVSNKWLSDSKYSIIPIIEVESQSFFTSKEFFNEIQRHHAHRMKKEKQEKVPVSHNEEVLAPHVSAQS